MGNFNDPALEWGDGDPDIYHLGSVVAGAFVYGANQSPDWIYPPPGVIVTPPWGQPPDPPKGRRPKAAGVPAYPPGS